MENILDKYLSLVSEESESKLNESSYLSEYNDEQIEQIKQMREQLKNADNQLKNYFPSIPIDSIETKKETAQVNIEYAYCPKCHQKLYTNMPIRTNAYTGEKFVHYVCDCGFRCSLAKKYPLITVQSENGDEIELEKIITKDCNSESDFSVENGYMK